MSTYTYSIQGDFPNHTCDAGGLAFLLTSAGLPAPDSIDTMGDACNVHFAAPLTAPQKATLDGVVATDQGFPLPGDGDLNVYGTTTDGQTLSLPIPVPFTGNMVTVNWTFQGTVTAVAPGSAATIGDSYSQSGVSCAKNVGAAVTTPVPFVNEADSKFSDASLIGCKTSNTFGASSFTIDQIQAAAGATIAWRLKGTCSYGPIGAVTET